MDGSPSRRLSTRLKSVGRSPAPPPRPGDAAGGAPVSALLDSRPSAGASLLRPVTSPARPGPGPTPPALLRALDVTVGRRIDGLLVGEHRSTTLGLGTELAQVRPYVPGDDVRRMDWNVTARARMPHVRVHVAERSLVTWLVLDTSPSMTFGTADRRKADVAEGVALVMGHVATRRGNRLGVMTFGDGRPLALPPRQGQTGLLPLLITLRREPQQEGAGATSIGESLRRVARLARQRALVVVVSDFRGPRDWRRPLLHLAGRHDILAVEIRDPREQELPDVGELSLVDPETGRQLNVDTGDRRLRQRFAARAAAEREEVAGDLRSSGARHVVLSTAGDWLHPLATFLRHRGPGSQRWAPASGGAAISHVSPTADSSTTHDRPRPTAAATPTPHASPPPVQRQGG